MCGRYLLHAPLEKLQRAFGFAERPNLRARYNIAPSQEIAIVRKSAYGGARELAMVRWGLIPFWSKDPKIAYRCINARAEGIAGKPAFREAFRRRRCLVLADGFFEWAKLDGGKGKQPILIRPRSGEPMAFAGLWERWNGAEGEVQSATIVTGAPNGLVSPIHDRMPVILDPADYDRWLDPSLPDAEALLHPCPAELLEAVPVSKRVNAPANDDERLIEPLVA